MCVCTYTTHTATRWAAAQAVCLCAAVWGLPEADTHLHGICAPRSVDGCRNGSMSGEFGCTNALSRCLLLSETSDCVGVCGLLLVHVYFGLIIKLLWRVMRPDRPQNLTAVKRSHSWFPGAEMNASQASEAHGSPTYQSAPPLQLPPAWLNAASLAGRGIVHILPVTPTHSMHSPANCAQLRRGNKSDEMGVESSKLRLRIYCWHRTVQRRARRTRTSTLHTHHKQQRGIREDISSNLRSAVTVGIQLAKAQKEVQ